MQIVVQLLSWCCIAFGRMLIEAVGTYDFVTCRAIDSSFIFGEAFVTSLTDVQLFIGFLMTPLLTGHPLRRGIAGDVAYPTTYAAHIALPCSIVAVVFLGIIDCQYAFLVCSVRKIIVAIGYYTHSWVTIFVVEVSIDGWSVVFEAVLIAAEVVRVDG